MLIWCILNNPRRKKTHFLVLSWALSMYCRMDQCILELHTHCGYFMSRVACGESLFHHWQPDHVALAYRVVCIQVHTYSRTLTCARMHSSTFGGAQHTCSLPVHVLLLNGSSSSCYVLHMNSWSHHFLPLLSLRLSFLLCFSCSPLFSPRLSPPLLPRFSLSLSFSLPLIFPAFSALSIHTVWPPSECHSHRWPQSIRWLHGEIWRFLHYERVSHSNASFCGNTVLSFMIMIHSMATIMMRSSIASSTIWRYTHAKRIVVFTSSFAFSPRFRFFFGVLVLPVIWSLPVILREDLCAQPACPLIMPFDNEPLLL